MSATEASDATPETPADSAVDTTPVDPNAVTISINGREVAARKGEWIIAAADRADEYIPRFCYHPRMESVGMCRQCLVEVEGPRGPMMVVSCMTPVADGQVVRTNTDQVKRAHEGILELLLANHPLDCPVCDKGGECPLQDQAFSHGPGESRFVEEKRHYEKPIPISDLVFLDRERCILCDRCTRFADEVAGDPLISFTHRGNNTQVLTFPDEPFASYFSGNTVQICPVGALTAQPYRFKARPWDLEQRESTCTTCSVGCRIVVQSSRDELVRYQGVDSDPVNWGWLCDRGRFNFQSVNSEDRLTAPLMRKADSFAPASWSTAIDEVARAMRHANAGSVAILGGARGTNEDAFMWAKLADALGVTMRDAQLGDGLPVSVFNYPAATIDDTCAAPTIILLSPDLKEELPVLYLRVRDSVQKKRSRVIEFSARKTGLTKYAWKSVQSEPGRQLDAVRAALKDADVVAQLAKGPVVVVAGRGNIAESADVTMACVDAIVSSVANASVLPVLRRGNVRGALSLGLAPQNDVDATAILEACAGGKVECLVLLGADPIVDFPDADLARRALGAVRHVIAIDTFMTESARRAHVVLPAAAFGEKDGTTTNLEGRVSNVVQKITPRGTARADWMIAAEIAAAAGSPLGVLTVNDVQSRIANEVPGFDGISVPVAVRRNGVVVSVPALSPLNAPTVSVGERNAYDFRLVSSRTMYDGAVGTAMSQSLSGLATVGAAYVHPLDAERIGSSDGATVRIASASASVNVTLRTSDDVTRGTVWVPFNHEEADVRDLVSARGIVTDVKIESPR